MLENPPDRQHRLKPVLLNLCFFGRCDDFVQSYLFLWGRMASCGRLAIGLTIFLHITRRIANPPQVTNLPHMIRINLWRSRAVPPHAERFLMVAQTLVCVQNL